MSVQLPPPGGMKLLIIDEDDESRWYSSPGDGYVYSEKEAHRYDLADFDMDYPGLTPEQIVLTYPDKRKNVINIEHIRIAPESVAKAMRLGQREEGLVKLIKAGEAALKKTQLGRDFDSLFEDDEMPGMGVNPEAEAAEYEETTLESGQLVRHHTWKVCTPPCPLHMPSNHPLVLADRHYNASTKMILRMCRHDVEHPDPDDIKVREMPHLSVHSCCREKCCKPKED